MSVDVTTSIVIARPRDAVASFAADPDNAVRWYVNIKAVRWVTPRPVAIGSRIEFEAEFLGRRLSYVYEVTVLVPGERLTMRTAEGPFPMETTYEWRSVTPQTTEMTLRNHGNPAGFSRLVSPIMSLAMRRANTKDLARLKAILEQRGAD
jgi:hypothetical protein